MWQVVVKIVGLRIIASSIGKIQSFNERFTYAKWLRIDFGVLLPEINDATILKCQKPPAYW